MPLMKNTERQNKHGIVGIKCLHPVIATFIHIDNEVAELPFRRICCHDLSSALSLAFTFKEQELLGS